MSNENGEGAASAAPSTPEEAEQQLNAATTPEEAWRIYEACVDREENWRVVKLKAERRYGELLGPSRRGGDTTGASNKQLDAAYMARSRARKVAAVSQEDFDSYISEHGAKSSREGLLREHGEKKAPKPRKPQPVTDKPDGLWQNESVLTWVSRRMRAGSRRDDLMNESKAGLHGWPIEGEHLPQNAADRCVAIIKDRANRPKDQSKAGKRLHGLHARRRAGGEGDNGLWHAQIEIMKMVGLLEMIDFPRLGIQDASPETVAEIYHDLTELQVWLDVSTAVVADAVDDLGKLRLIKQLRDTTGRSPEEAKVFLAMADKLERERLGLTG